MSEGVWAGFRPARCFYFITANAAFRRRNVSSFPKISMMSNMCGPRAAPMIVIRNEFITVPVLWPFFSIQSITIFSMLADVKSLMPSRIFQNSAINAGLSSFQRFLIDFSSYSVGASKKKFVSSHRSATNEILVFTIPTMRSSVASAIS